MKGATQDQVAGAYAQVANASAQLQRLLDGAKPAQIDAAQAQVHSAETALYLSQLQLNKATITAPMDGAISKMQTAAGSMAAPTGPLLTLLSDNVRVTIPVEESRLPQLKIGQPAVVKVQAYPDRTFAGKIAIIAPELDPATRTVQVTILPTDEDRLLHPGMSATAELSAE
jgi:RND family efflux transporter MFP subunit